MRSYKPKDIIIEFIIVILGITIAFWLSNLGEEKKGRQMESAYLADIKSDLQDDYKSLSSQSERMKPSLKP